MITLGFVVILGAFQGGLISATSGEDDIKTIIQEMKDVIARLQEKDQKFEKQIEILNTRVDYQQMIIEEQQEMVEKMKKENLVYQETITALELQAKNCKEELLITLETQTKNLTSLTEVVHDVQLGRGRKRIIRPN